MTERDRRPSGYVQTPTLLLGASLGANMVLLVGLVSLLLLGHSGFFSPGTSSASSPPGVSTPSQALRSPTSTPSPTPTATPAPVSGWLQVMPASVHLGCNNGQQMQFVVLINNGSAAVQWQVNNAAPANQPALNISPNQGTLNAGTSIALQVQNQTHANGPQGVPSQQGVIDFVVETPDAGVPPRLSYTTVGCH
ncbi:MAG: BACON domain-containing protein [Ktedonobacterales bacterium]